MTNDPDDLQRHITDLEAQLAALKAAQAAPAIHSPTAARDVNVATNQTIHNYGAGVGPAPATQIGEYLRGMGGECNRLSLVDADSSDPNRATIELAAVYTGLEVTTTVELSAEDRKKRRAISTVA